MRFILGSGSPRRKNILGQIFDEIEILVPYVDETFVQGETPYDYTRRITELKLNYAAARVKGIEKYILLTSDTIVCINDKILGKPVSEEDAYSMLSTLSGMEHFVITGISLEYNNGGIIKRIYDYEKTSVFFKKLDDSGIKKYLSLVDCSDKAGSYAVQEHGDMIIHSVNGSLTNVIGFPLRLFFRMLNTLNLMDLF